MSRYISKNAMNAMKAKVWLEDRANNRHGATLRLAEYLKVAPSTAHKYVHTHRALVREMRAS